MSSSSRHLLVGAAIACAIAVPGPSHALNVHAVYRTACTRELGVILKVEKRNIRLLGLDGTIRKIPRHEIVSLAYYPMSQLPLAKLPAKPSVPALRITTQQDGKIVDLATGWPVDYSDTKVAILLDSGKDVVIEKDSIWSLEFVRQLDGSVRNTTSAPVVFAHPQTAGFCAQSTDDTGARPVFAQQILNDRIVIKRELDRLQEGYEEILEFEGDQKFYPVPHVYKDRTALGLWVSVLSRYGASKTRSNNVTPMLVDELHLGPFRYQHLFMSGSAPNQHLLHNEAQSQIYYRFKAAYFHASVFIDPNLVLVGTKYNWRREDLADETVDDRMNEILSIEFGFDFGPFALQLAPAVLAQAAVKAEGLFETKQELNLWRAGVRFTQRKWEAEVLAGIAKADGYTNGDPDAGELEGSSEWQYAYARGNLSFEPIPRIGALASVIYRGLDYQAFPFDGGGDVASYQSTSISSALQAWFRLSHRFDVGGNVIIEYQSRQGPGSPSPQRRVMPKFGLFTSFSF